MQRLATAALAALVLTHTGAFDPTLPEPASVHEMHQSKVGDPHLRRRNRRIRMLQANGGFQTGELTPLYPGYGTHFSYVWVGTPGQRVSVIVDTGSSMTAFPCKDCTDCGLHTDAYWDWNKSSTAKKVMCGNEPCGPIGQGYSEGSTWRAYKYSDKFYVGGETVSTVSTAASYSIDFIFGCQFTEDGLFRTQKADGIMGMGMSEITLPTQLFKQGITKTKMFAMCFKKDGGIMTLGGVDQRINTKPIQWADLSLVGSSGWFGIKLEDILFVNRKNGARTSIEGDADTYTSGEGSIVDSGTTDTYLPNAVKKKFQSIFKDLTGMSYSNDNQAISPAKLAKIPDLVFRVRDVNDKIMEITMPWTSLAEQLHDGSYALRIYFQDGDGAVLGANFMAGHNIIFDEEGSRVGFADSPCDWSQISSLPAASPVPATKSAPTSPTTTTTTTTTTPAKTVARPPPTAPPIPAKTAPVAIVTVEPSPAPDESTSTATITPPPTTRAQAPSRGRHLPTRGPTSGKLHKGTTPSPPTIAPAPHSGSGSGDGSGPGPGPSSQTGSSQSSNDAGTRGSVPGDDEVVSRRRNLSLLMYILVPFLAVAATVFACLTFCPRRLGGVVGSATHGSDDLEMVQSVIHSQDSALNPFKNDEDEHAYGDLDDPESLPYSGLPNSSSRDGGESTDSDNGGGMSDDSDDSAVGVGGRMTDQSSSQSFLKTMASKVVSGAPRRIDPSKKQG